MRVHREGQPPRFTPIQNHIADYWNGSHSDFTLRCLVGMLETGEAVEADFIAVGGIDLWDQVDQWKRKNDRNDERMEHDLHSQYE